MPTLLWNIDKDTPPPFNNVAYFERSCDPFNPKKLQAALDKNVDASDVPESGWMGIDWGENPICFIPDGTGFTLPKPEFELVKGYFKDGRMFAYPVAEYTKELKERHATEFAKRKAA